MNHDLLMDIAAAAIAAGWIATIAALVVDAIASRRPDEPAAVV